jgi:predicted RNA-binding protein Jag
MYDTKEEKIELVKQTILDVVSKCGIDASVEYEESLTLGLVFNIATADSHFLIGRQGSHLHALQILVQALVSKKLQSSEGQSFFFTLDVDDYKRKREWFLKQTAKQAVEHLKRTGRSVRLEAMANYDRKLVHMYLQENHPEIVSESVGFEPNRKVVIKLK